MNVSNINHKGLYLLKGGLHRSSIPFGIIKSQIKELPLCSNKRSAIFKASGEYQAALGATHRKYKYTSFRVAQFFYNFLLILHVSIDIDRHQTCYTGP
jgi:hypothetical protein